MSLSGETVPGAQARCHPSKSASRSPTSARGLALWSMATSGVLLVLLAAAWHASGSVLALAQASDSLADGFTAVVLLLALRVSAGAPDDGHPFGHHGAQPIAALIVAVLTGVLAIEVLRSAIGGLLDGDTPRLPWMVAAVFGTKLVAKAAIVVAASGHRGTRASPVARAIRIDARNDVAVSGLAILGFFSARYGHPSVDAWLAIPVAVWIGVAGVQLAMDNIRLLMGQAPADATQAELRVVVAAVAGVRRVTELRARHHGTSIVVRATIVVEDTLTLRQALTIGEATERALMARDDISDAAINVTLDQVSPGVAHH